MEEHRIAEDISLLLLALSPVIFRQSEFQNVYQHPSQKFPFYWKESKEKKNLSSKKVFLFCHFLLQEVNSQTLKQNLGFRNSYLSDFKKKSCDYIDSCFFRYTQFYFFLVAPWCENKIKPSKLTIAFSVHRVLFFAYITHLFPQPPFMQNRVVCSLKKKYMKMSYT